MKKKELYSQIIIIGLLVSTFFSAILAFISPLPLIYSYKRFGQNITIFIILSSAFITVIIGKTVYLIIFLLWPVMPSVVIGLQICNKTTLPLQSLIIRTIAYILVFYGLFTGLMFSIEGNNYFISVKNQVEKQMELVYKNISNEASIMGLNGKVYKGKEKIKTYITNNFLSLMIIVIVVFVILNLYFFSNLFPETINKNDFYKWRTPFSFIWLTLFFGFMVIFAKGTLLIVSENIFRLTLVPYFFQGITVAAFYLSKKNMPNLINFIIIISLAIFLILPSTIIGLVDNWLNFRKQKKIECV